ncbi:hypothetical protein DL98DRAFT_515243 [Cadophora sp. DSE1049]|nr:hypothetical protein DL98DRAFT_515243 [Cadophora sp. DSE1049]
MSPPVPILNTSAVEEFDLQLPAPSTTFPLSPPFKCTWLDCDQSKTFPRRSDLTKHMDRHTRPYACHNPSCSNVDFGDKAGLRRHENERHGVTKFSCPISSCRRHVKGFARKRNLDLHVKTCHQQGASKEASAENGFSTSSKLVEGNMGEQGQGIGSVNTPETVRRSSMESGCLQAKLLELEKEKRELELCQARVEGDILALKRALQIVSG